MEVPFDHAPQVRDILLRLDRFQVDHLRVVELLETLILVQYVSYAAAHPGGEVAPGGAEHHHGTPSHVLATVFADALDDSLGARVSYREALSCEAPEVGLAPRCSVERDVAYHYALLRLVARLFGGVYGDATAGEALAHVVVGRALQVKHDAPGKPGAEGLAGHTFEVYADRTIRQALVAVAARYLPGEHPTDRASRVLDRYREANVLLVLQSPLATNNQLVIQRLVEVVILLLGVPS